MWNSFNRTFYVLVRLTWNFVWLLISSTTSWIYYFFLFRVHSRKSTDTVPDLRKNMLAVFLDTNSTRSSELFKLLTCFRSTDSYQFWWPSIASRSQVCQKHRPRIAFLRFLSSVVQALYGWYIHAHYVLCDSGVQVKEIIHSWMLVIALLDMRLLCFHRCCRFLRDNFRP